MTAPLLQVAGLKVAYGGIEAVRQVDLVLDPGEFIGIIGSNGAGKSSMLRAISGVVAPAAGTITFAGEDITGLPSYRIVARGMAMVPEGRQIFADQTVEDNLVLGAYLRTGTGDVAADTARVLGLFPLLRERLTRVFDLVARGLLSRPKLLVVDELSLGLAPKILDLLFPVLIDLNREGLSILLVEQMASYALQVTHRTYVMENGRILMQGRSAALANDPRVLDTYLGRHTVS